MQRGFNNKPKTKLLVAKESVSFLGLHLANEADNSKAVPTYSLWKKWTEEVA